MASGSGQGEQQDSSLGSGQRGIDVEQMLRFKALRLAVLAGEEGLGRRITAFELQRPGLALAGHGESLHAERVQVIGLSEASFLTSLDEQTASDRIEMICGREPPCLVLTGGCQVPPMLVGTCDSQAVPLLRTSLPSGEFMREAEEFLTSWLGPMCTTHGVLVDVFGVGVLLLGDSGIGKSEVALDLVLRGHRLVSDDVVEMRCRAHALVGSGPELIMHHIEIRGLGILNIKDLFGIAAVRDSKRIDLVVELVEWDEGDEYDRLGVDDQTAEFIGVEVPRIRLPVRPGRNMSAIIEVAARNQLLKQRGHFSARQFQDRLVRAIAEGRSEVLVRRDVE